MKTLLSLFSIALAFLVTAAAQAQTPAAPGTVKFAVNGMVCAFCAQGIEKRLTKLPETGPLYINLANKLVAVEPKPGRTIDIARVKAEIIEAGYEVRTAEPVTQTVAAIRAEMQARK